MRNISNQNKISKEILTIGPYDKPILILKHLIILHKASKPNNMKMSYYFEYRQKSDYAPFEKTTNVIFKKLSDCLILESKVYQDISSPYSSFINHRIYFKDIIEVKKMFDIVEEWFNKYDNMYKLDSREQIIDLNEQYRELLAIAFSKFDSGKYISIQPTVVFDNTYTYPGVSIKTDKGLIGNISYDEFLLLKLSITEYYNNWNLLSINLLQLAYLHAIGLPADSNPIDF